jgi:tRNA A-37 threonylcarbamoyl transferase component Bud32
MLSTLIGLIPEKDRRIYARMQSDVAKSHMNDVSVELKKLPSDFLARVAFPLDLVGSASMGEVYKLRMKGEDSFVYGKFLTGPKRREIEAVLVALGKVASDLEKNKARFSGNIDYARLMRAMIESVKKQLDYQNEAKNGILFDPNKYNRPQYPEGLTGESYMVMTPVRGRSLGELLKTDEPDTKKKAAEAYVDQFLSMLFDEGIYHADPHPGNVLWDTQTNTLGWIDFGIVYIIGPEDRLILCKLLAASQINNADGLADALIEAKQGRHDVNRKELVSSLQGLSASSAQSKLIEAITIAGKHDVYLDKNIAQAVVTLLTMLAVASDLSAESSLGTEKLTAKVMAYFTNYFTSQYASQHVPQQEDLATNNARASDPADPAAEAAVKKAAQDRINWLNSAIINKRGAKKYKGQPINQAIDEHMRSLSELVNGSQSEITAANQETIISDMAQKFREKLVNLYLQEIVRHVESLCHNAKFEVTTLVDFLSELNEIVVNNTMPKNALITSSAEQVEFDENTRTNILNYLNAPNLAQKILDSLGTDEKVLSLVGENLTIYADIVLPKAPR